MKIGVELYECLVEAVREILIYGRDRGELPVSFEDLNQGDGELTSWVNELIEVLNIDEEE